MKLTRRAFLAGTLAATACAGVSRSGRRHSLPPSDPAVDALLFCGWHGPFPRQLEQRLAEGRIGGIVIARHNVRSLDELVRLVERIRGLASKRVFIAVTQEGGRIKPLVPEMTEWPAAAKFGERRHGAEVSTARQAGRAMGRELRAIGIDINFAPVLDVNRNPANPVIGSRAFHWAPHPVMKIAWSWADGHGHAGMITCGKHFPGHGGTATDSHVTLPVDARAADELRRYDVYPFKALAWRLPMMMTGHVVYPALDPAHPATLSPIVLELLTVEIGFEGLVITDDLEMRAITAHQSVPRAAVRAVEAGCHALLIAHTPALQDDAAVALTAALRDPAASDLRRKVLLAGTRIVALRPDDAGVLPRPPLSVVGCAAHRELAARIARG